MDMPTKGPQPPRGPRYPTDAEWKDAVRRRLAELGMTQKQLADKVGCVPSAIAQMLAVEAKESSLKPLVHQALGWPAPSSGPAPDGGAPAGLPLASSDISELTHLWDAMTPEQRLEVWRRVVPTDKRIAIRQLLGKDPETLTANDLEALSVILGEH